MTTDTPTIPAGSVTTLTTQIADIRARRTALEHDREQTRVALAQLACTAPASTHDADIAQWALAAGQHSTQVAVLNQRMTGIEGQLAAYPRQILSLEQRLQNAMGERDAAQQDYDRATALLATFAPVEECLQDAAGVLETVVRDLRRSAPRESEDLRAALLAVRSQVQALVRLRLQQEEALQRLQRFG